MKIWTMTYFGISSVPDPFDQRDVERWQSIKEALNTFESRCDLDPYYPYAKDAAELHVFFYNPYQNGDCIPDRIYTFGPRGGIKRDV